MDIGIIPRGDITKSAAYAPSHEEPEDDERENGINKEM